MSEGAALSPVDGLEAGSGPRADVAVEILAALRDVGEAAAALRKRTRERTGIGDTDIAALELLLSAAAAGQALSGRDLADRLDVTTAAVSGLVDRLERNGLARREARENDRRSVSIVPTEAARTAVAKSVGMIHERMLDLAERMDPDDARTTLSFLRQMLTEIDALR